MMAKYRKKPVVIEAEQFMGVGWYEAKDLPYPKGVCHCIEGGGECQHSHLHTMHEDQTVLLAVGDWVISDSKPGTFYPCKPDVFEANYEPVEPERGSDEGRG